MKNNEQHRIPWNVIYFLFVIKQDRSIDDEYCSFHPALRKFNMKSIVMRWIIQCVENLMKNSFFHKTFHSELRFQEDG